MGSFSRAGDWIKKTRAGQNAYAALNRQIDSNGDELKRLNKKLKTLKTDKAKEKARSEFDKIMKKQDRLLHQRYLMQQRKD